MFAKRFPRFPGVGIIQRLVPTGLSIRSWMCSRISSSVPQRYLCSVADLPSIRLPNNCSGCGVKLQTGDAQGLGYYRLPVSVEAQTAAETTSTLPTESEPLPETQVACVCQRCHRAKHYGHLVPVTMPYEEFEKPFKAVIDRRDVALVVVLDVTDVHGSLLPELGNLPPGRADDVVFAVNKCDLLPGEALKHKERLETWVRTELKRFKVPGGVHVHIVSSKLGTGVRDLMASIQDVQKGRDVFVVGAANVGKSTLVNRLVAYAHGTTPNKALGGAVNPLRKRKSGDVHDFYADLDDDVGSDRDHVVEDADVVDSPFAAAVEFDLAAKAGKSAVRTTTLPPFVTTSPLPGTTLQTVSVPFALNTRLHDTPGVVLFPKKQGLMETLATTGGADNIKKVMLLKRRGAPTYRLAPNRSLFIGGLARVDYMNDYDDNDCILLTWHGELGLHATNTARAPEVWSKHRGGLLVPEAGDLTVSEEFPLKELTVLPGFTGTFNLTRTQQRVKDRARQAVVDVVFSGLGWMTVTPIPILGTRPWSKTIEHARLRVVAHPGVPVYLRHPLLPFETQGMRPSDWKT